MNPVGTIRMPSHCQSHRLVALILLNDLKEQGWNEYQTVDSRHACCLPNESSQYPIILTRGKQTSQGTGYKDAFSIWNVQKITGRKDEHEPD